MDPPVPFERIGHILSVPVTLGSSTASSFILDTGIGVAMIDRTLADRLGVRPDGRRQRGRRMSGQEVEATLAVLPELRLGTQQWTDVTVALLDLKVFLPPSMAHIGGFLSLVQLQETPLTIDYRGQTVALGARRPMPSGGAVEVPLYLERDGASLSAYADLSLPDGATARVEVDLGSDCLILHDRYMAELGFDADAPSSTVARGNDETGHEYVRTFGTLDGTVALGSATQRNPPVMFQEIIYDGLVGDQFLRNFEVTIDLPRSRMLLAPPRA